MKVLREGLLKNKAKLNIGLDYLQLLKKSCLTHRCFGEVTIIDINKQNVLVESLYVHLEGLCVGKVESN